MQESGVRIPVPQTESVEVLGTLLAHDGSTHTASEHRLRKANAAFWAHKDTLLHRHTPLRDRIRTFYSEVVSVALHGPGSWAWACCITTRTSSTPCCL